MYGAGTILGAGIYVMIGEIVGEAGLWAPVAFAVAAGVAAVNGLVYAELSTRMPSAGGPTDYVRQVFDQDWLTGLMGWLIVATGVISAATITHGFSGYAHHFAPMLPVWTLKLGTLVILGGIALAGARESAWFMAITTTLGLIGLGIVLAAGFFGPATPAVASAADWLEQAPSPWTAATATSVLTAGFLAVYAFIGFEDIVHMAEEVKRPSRALPMAIVVSLVLATVLYVGVSIAALRIMAPDALADSQAPLVDVVGEAGWPTWPVAALSAWMILNGTLAQVIMASRVMWSLARRGGAPSVLSRIWERTSTPWVATVLATGVALALSLFFPLKVLGSMTSFVILIVFGVSNVAMIVLERREPEAPFDVPAFVPWMGLVLCVVMLVASAFVGGGH